MTTSMFRRAVLASAAAVALGAAALTGARAGLTMNAPPTSPVIATVDLEVVVAGLHERTDKEASLKASLAEAKSKLEKMVDEVKAEESKLSVLPKGPVLQAAAKSLREKMIRVEFEKQYTEKLLVEMQGEMLRDLYIKITEAVQRLAQKSGYTLVLASDERVQAPNGDMQTLTRAISLKRILYADDAMDITQELVTLMNNEYSAGGAAGATPAPAPKAQAPK